MTAPPQLGALFFDVFGTCVAQRPSVASELSKATREALESDSSLIDDEVKTKAEQMTYDDWDQFGAVGSERLIAIERLFTDDEMQDWNEDVEDLVQDGKAKDRVDWKAIDEYRFQSFRKLLARRGLVILGDSVKSSDLEVEKGSLWNASQLRHLGAIWHRLPPWPDTCAGLELLNKKFSTVALSNTYDELMKSLVARSSIPFHHVYTADLFQSYKPNPKVYLGAAEKMGVKPEECALVAAHLGDLKGAKACGFYTIYIERPLEEKTPDLRKENIPDMVVEEGANGFVTLAERLGIQAS